MDALLAGGGSTVRWLPVGVPDASHYLVGVGRFFVPVLDRFGVPLADADSPAMTASR